MPKRILDAGGRIMDERLYIEDFDGFVMRKSRVVFLRDHGIEPINVFPCSDNRWRIVYVSCLNTVRM